MPNRIQGCEGNLFLEDGGNVSQLVVDTTSVTIDRASATNQLNVHGDCNAQTIASTKSYTISCEGLISTDDLGQAEIEEGDTVPWIWWATAGRTAGDPNYAGTVVIDSLSLTFPADGQATFSMSATGSGALAKNNVVL